MTRADERKQRGECVKTKMAGLIGSIGPCDESVEQWSACIECFDYLVLGNEIKAEDIVPTFLL